MSAGNATAIYARWNNALREREEGRARARAATSSPVRVPELPFPSWNELRSFFQERALEMTA